MVKKITMWLYLEPLLYSEEYLHLSDISRKLEKNHAVVRQYLNFFESLGVLSKKIKGRLTMYKVNFSHPLIIDYMVLAEKEKLTDKCKKDLIINEIVGFLHNNLNENNKALIFGSSVINSRKAEDIDLLISGKINENKIKEFEKKFNVSIHLINIKNLNSVKQSLKKEIKTKHLIVQGSEEIIKWLI